MVFLLVMYGLVLWSPVTAALGMRWTYFMLAVGLATLAISVLRGRPVKLWLLALCTTFLSTIAITAAYWSDVRFLAFPIAFFVAAFLLSQSTLREIERFVDLASGFVLIMLILAVVAFALTMGGMGPLYEFPRPGQVERSIYFFATTLTNAYWDPLIRPAGIYDEPGALSFVVCLVAFMRHALGRDYKLTWVLLLLGFVTLSLAHLVFVAVFFLAERLTLKKLGFAFVIGASMALLLASPEIRSVFAERLFARLTITAAGTIAGDNRSNGMLNAWDIIRSDSHVLYFGVDPACSFDGALCDSRHPPRGENPLQHLAERGIFASWPYYMFLAIAGVLVLRGRRNLPFLAVALLFLQRPYLFSFGYALLGVIALWLQLIVYPRRLLAGESGPAYATSIGGGSTVGA